MRFLLAATLVTTVATLAAGPTVSQKNKMFSVGTLTVKPGEDVTFTNDDAVVHNVFSATPGKTFNLKTQTPGATTHVSFDQEGTVDVRCAIHPTMKLTITVKH